MRRFLFLFPVWDSVSRIMNRKAALFSRCSAIAVIVGGVTVPAFAKADTCRANLYVTADSVTCTRYWDAGVYYGDQHYPDETYTVENRPFCDKQGKLIWKTTVDVAWLGNDGGKLSSSPPKNKDESALPLNISVINTMQPNVYTGQVCVWGEDAQNSPQCFFVTLFLHGPGFPVISLSSTSLEISVPIGGSASAGLVIRNSGGIDTTVNWNATSSAAWLTLDRPTGSIGSTGEVLVTLTVNAASLPSGTHYASVWFDDPNAVPSRVSVSVKVIVTPPKPSITLDPTLMVIDATAGSSVHLSQQLRITNTGSPGSVLSWAASGNQTWLSINPATGSLAKSLSDLPVVTIDPSGIGVGTHPARITVVDDNASNSPQYVDVTLRVVANDSLSATPQTGPSEVFAPGETDWVSGVPGTVVVGVQDSSGNIDYSFRGEIRFDTQDQAASSTAYLLDSGVQTLEDLITLRTVQETGLGYRGVTVRAFQQGTENEIANATGFSVNLWFHVPATIHPWIRCGNTFGNEDDPGYGRGLACPPYTYGTPFTASDCSEVYHCPACSAADRCPVGSVTGVYPAYDTHHECGPCPCSKFVALPFGGSPCGVGVLVTDHSGLIGQNVVGAWDRGPKSSNDPYWKLPSRGGLPGSEWGRPGIDLSDAFAAVLAYSLYCTGSPSDPVDCGSFPRTGGTESDNIPKPPGSVDLTADYGVYWMFSGAWDEPVH